jgi:hypothetical protein
MAKRVIILDRLDTPMLAFHAVLWANVPLSLQSKYANPTFVSAYKEASAAELTALRAGQIAEKVITISVVPGTTIFEIQAQLREAFIAWQAEVATRNPWEQYGTYYDDVTGWTVGGVS